MSWQGTTTDSFGSPTTSPLAAMQGINDFAEGFVAYETRAVNVLSTADDNPDSALANIYAGMLWMFLERPEAPEKSLPYSQRSEQLGELNHREQGLLALLKAWQRHDYPRVLSIAEALCQVYPQDLPLLKIAQYHAFNAGNASLMLKMALAAESANRDRAPVYSMIAFGHEQSNQINEAESAACRALALNQDEPWAHHALAHVHLSRGTTREGLQILTNSADSWTGLNSFMFTHNWWHVALFDIAHGDVQSALRIYDERCWGVQPEYSQDQIGAVSLLARLEIAGVDLIDRWQALRPFLEQRDDDVVQPFLTLQYLYGLAKAGSPRADNLMALIGCQAERPVVTSDKALWCEVGIPVARAIVAHARGDHEEAAKVLGPIRSHIWRVGGSHAQRDLFEQILLDARLKAGHWEPARKMLEQRRRWEPESPLLYEQLNNVYRQINLK